MSLFEKNITIFDGAIGTELYQRGFYINRPFEELNILSAADVQAVHTSYIDAGAEVITTNTYSITKFQLSKFDLENKQRELLFAAIDNATSAKAASGKSHIKIGLSIGPTGQLIEPLGPLGKLDVQKEYAHLTELALAAPHPIDFINLETFSNLSELENAILGIRQTSKEIPILASVTAPRSGLETFLFDFAARMSHLNIQTLGLNCSDGPSHLLNALKILFPLTELPIVVQPNAGIPQQINGRYFYMTSPDYVAKFAKRFAELGAMGVGGCCGTGPEHIKAIASALKVAQAKDQVLKARHQVKADETSAKARVEIIKNNTPFISRPESAIAQHIRENKKILSIEISSPKGIDTEKFYENLLLLDKSGVSFVNIPDNPRANTRMSSLHLSVAIKNRRDLKLQVLPHLTTRDRNLIALQSDLLGAYVNGVKDVLLVTGDPPKLGNNKDATGVYDIDSIGLTYLTHCLNCGTTPSGESLGSQTHFGIGVAANPTALNLELEIQRWKYKCESGADFAVTQPIYEPTEYFKWLDMTASHHRPHLIGLWPLISLRNAEFMANEVPGVKVPQWVLEEMSKAGDNKEEAKKRGVAIAQKIYQAVSDHCAGFCISAPLGNVSVALDVLK